MILRLGRAFFILFLFVFVGFRAPRPSNRGIVVVCAGDSITAATYPDFLEKLLNQGGVRAKVINRGRNGNTSGEYLSFLLKSQGDLALARPDFVLLQLGTNDVRVDGDSTSTEAFESNMHEIVAIFRTFRNLDGERAIVLLATIPPIPPGVGFPFSAKSRERVAAEINPLLRTISQKENITLVDNYSLFAASPELLRDVHPNQEGYRRLAQNWYLTLNRLLSARKPTT